MQRRLLRNGEFDFVENLTAKIINFIRDYNQLAAMGRESAADRMRTTNDRLARGVIGRWTRAGVRISPAL